MKMKSMLDDIEKRFIENIYIKHYKLMKKHAFHIVKEVEDAEDMVQESIIRLMKRSSLLQILDPHVIPAYIISTVRRCSLNHVLSSKYKNYKTILSFSDEISSEIPDSSKDVELEVLFHFTLDELAKAIDKLPVKEQNILIYKYLLGMQDEEIAAKLCIQKNSVRQYLTIARRKAYSIYMDGNLEKPHM